MFSLSRSARDSSTEIFDRLALNVNVETLLLVRLLQPLLLVEVRVLYYSPLSFQPNLSLTIFSASSALPLQTKTDTTSSFF